MLDNGIDSIESDASLSGLETDLLLEVCVYRPRCPADTGLYSDTTLFDSICVASRDFWISRNCSLGGLNLSNDSVLLLNTGVGN